MTWGRRWIGTWVTEVVGSAVVLCAVALAASGPAAASTGTSAGPNGDPKGLILSELAAIRSSVPPKATDVQSFGQEPVITHSCFSTMPGVAERITFRSSAAVSLVQSEVDTSLRHSGWGHRSETVLHGSTLVGNSQESVDNPVERWTRLLPQGKAGASLSVSYLAPAPHRGQTLEWLLAATAMGVGEPKRHCGTP